MTRRCMLKADGKTESSETITVSQVKITESLDPTREAFKILFNLGRLAVVLAKDCC